MKNKKCTACGQSEFGYKSICKALILENNLLCNTCGTEHRITGFFVGLYSTLMPMILIFCVFAIALINHIVLGILLTIILASLFTLTVALFAKLQSIHVKAFHGMGHRHPENKSNTDS